MRDVQHEPCILCSARCDGFRISGRFDLCQQAFAWDDCNPIPGEPFCEHPSDETGFWIPGVDVRTGTVVGVKWDCLYGDGTDPRRKAVYPRKPVRYRRDAAGSWRPDVCSGTS